MKKYVFFLALAAVMLFFHTACNGNTAPEIDTTTGNIQADEPAEPVEIAIDSFSPEAIEGMLHQFDNLGFSFVLPASWEGKYGMDIHESEGWGTVELYHTATWEEFGELGSTFFEGEYIRVVGTLFRFGRSPGEHFTDDEPPIMAGGSRILARTGGYTYFMNFPSDAQWNYEAPESEATLEYLEMESQWEFIANSFRLLEPTEN